MPEGATPVPVFRHHQPDSLGAILEMSLPALLAGVLLLCSFCSFRSSNIGGVDVFLETSGPAALSKGELHYTVRCGKMVLSPFWRAAGPFLRGSVFFHVSVLGTRPTCP